MESLESGKELVFIGVSLSDIDRTWEEEVSNRSGNFPEDYKKMLTTINSHKLLKLNYKIGKLRVKLIDKDKAQGFITLSDSEEELGSALISTVPGFWSNDKMEFIEYKYFKEQLKDVLGPGHSFIEDLINSTKNFKLG